MTLRSVLAFIILAAFALPAEADAQVQGKQDRLVGKVEVLGRTPSDFAVERVELRALPVAIEPVAGDLKKAGEDLPKAINTLRARLGAAGLSAEDAPLVLFTSANETTYAAQILLPLGEPPKAPVEGLSFGTSPAVKALRILHKGSLESLEDTYFELQTFVEDGDFEIEDKTMERYLTDPATTAPKDMATEIYLLLK